MVKSELNRIMKTKKEMVALLIILAFPIVDFLQHIYFDVIVYGDLGAYHLEHPVYTAFLSGSCMGHVMQILFFWILPIYSMMLYADSYTDDVKSGYLKCLTSRVGRIDYYKTKFIIAALLPAILLLGSLIINLMMCIILFHNGSMFGGLEDFYETMDNWFIFGFNHPYLYYMFYSLSACIICSLSSILGLCCSIIFKNHFKAYPAVFIVWFIQILIPYGISNTVQPYTEYGIKYCLSGLAILIGVTLVFCITAYCMRIRKDEI